MSLLWMLLTGCSTVVEFPGDDTFLVPPAEDALFQEIRIDAFSTTLRCEDVYTLSMQTTGLGADLEVDLLGPEDTVERHTLFLSATFTQPILVDSWDLGPMSTALEYADGQSTAFSCDEVQELTYVVQLYQRGGALADCVAWGADFDRADAFTLQDDILDIGGCRWFDTLDPGM